MNALSAISIFMPICAQVSEKATDPAAWAELAHMIGGGGIFGVLLLLFMSAGAWILYRSTIGPDGFVRALVVDLHDRVVSFMAKLEATLDRLETRGSRDQQWQDDIRAAGLGFKDAVSAIGDKVGADVSKSVAMIEATLSRRNANS